MTDEQWPRVKALFQAALERPADERDAFLAAVAGGDEALRREVESLLTSDTSNVSFLDSSGIACLIRARALLGREERTLGLICPPGSTRRALEITGVDELVALYGSRDELDR